MEWLLSALVIAFGGMSIFFFSQILRKGVASFHEPNRKILIGELIGSIGIVGFGVISLIYYMLD